MATFKLRGIAILTIGILIGGAFLVAATMDIKSNTAKKEYILAKQSLTTQGSASETATNPQEVESTNSNSAVDEGGKQVSSDSTPRVTPIQKPGTTDSNATNTASSNNSSVKLAGFKPSESSATDSSLDDEQDENGLVGDNSDAETVPEHAQEHDSQEMVRNFYEPSYTKVVAKFPNADFVASLAAHDGAIDGSVSSVSMTYLETCEVVQVLSGDQFFCRLPNGLRQKFILYGIASPRSDQSYGLESKNALHNLLVGKKVFYYPVAYDEYSRLSVLLYVNNFEVNLLQVFNGNVFMNPYAKLDSRYELAQNKAHDDYVGLWNQRNWIGGRPPINPFTERK